MKRKLRTPAAAATATTAPAASLSGALEEAIALLRAERIDEAEPALLAILGAGPSSPTRCTSWACCGTRRAASTRRWH